MWRITFFSFLCGAAESSRKEKFSWRETQRGNQTMLGGDLKMEGSVAEQRRAEKASHDCFLV